jgi:hypothetical protein
MDSTSARDGTRADGVLDRGWRRLFSFWLLLPGGAVELPGRSRPAPGVVDLRWGGWASAPMLKVGFAWSGGPATLGHQSPQLVWLWSE